MKTGARLEGLISQIAFLRPIGLRVLFVNARFSGKGSLNRCFVAEWRPVFAQLID